MKLNIAEIKEKVQKIAEARDLSLVILFGSQARGRTHRRSDFDFGILGRRPFSPKEMAEHFFLFSQGLRLGEVELVDLKSAPPLLLKQIAKEGILIYEKEPFLFAEFRIYALKRYFESRPLLELRRLSFAKFLQTP